MSNEIKIAVSGKSGCGNSSVSGQLAQRLGVILVNYTFHNMADEEGIPFDELCLMAEKDTKWDYLVDERQIARANAQPCVLGSRLAIWLWKQAELRVYLDAPLEVRASRILKREGGELSTVLEKTRRRDERDHARYQRLYGIDNNAFSFADLVIDTSDKGIEQIVALVLAAWNSRSALA